MPFSSWQRFGPGLIFSGDTVVASCSRATSPASRPLSPDMSLLTRNSGYIFDGTVLSVERARRNRTWQRSHGANHLSGRAGDSRSRNGQVLAIREWAGLWTSGDRYRPGERLLLFLYRPSKLGLTSLVGGPLGRFPVDSGGNVILDNGRLVSPFTWFSFAKLASPTPSP